MKEFFDIEKIGFRVEAHKMDGINGIKKKIVMDSIPDIKDLVYLFMIVKNNFTIKFWDAFHRQISDPGAYCTGVVLNNNTVSYMEGNHGWSSEWKEMNIEDFAKFTQQNWDKDIDGGEFLNCIIIEDNKYHLPK
jgi:hypothetical protein